MEFWTPLRFLSCWAKSIQEQVSQVWPLKGFSSWEHSFINLWKQHNTPQTSRCKAMTRQSLDPVRTIFLGTVNIASEITCLVPGAREMAQTSCNAWALTSAGRCVFTSRILWRILRGIFWRTCGDFCWRIFFRCLAGFLGGFCLESDSLTL